MNAETDSKAQEIEYPTLPTILHRPYFGATHYMKMDSLQPAYALDGDQLLQYHHSLLGYIKRKQHHRPSDSKSLRAFYMIAAGWCQLELAQVRDGQGETAEATELYDMADIQAQRALDKVEREYRDREDYYDRWGSAKLLATFAPRFAQLRPSVWPEMTVEAMAPPEPATYAGVQTDILDPLLMAHIELRNDPDVRRSQLWTDLRGLIGEVVVLQCLQRLQERRPMAEWAVVPASTREDSSIGLAQTSGTLSGFDMKILFQDQSFVPIQVKSSNKYSKEYRPEIAHVIIGQDGHSTMMAAHAMRHEVNGGTLDERHKTALRGLTSTVLSAAGEAGISGPGIYRAGSLESAAAELALWSLIDRYEDPDMIV